MMKKKGKGGAHAPPKSKEATRKAVLQRTLKALETRHGRLTPNLVVEAARDPNSPLHREFDWNDATAAQSARLDRARQIITFVTITVVRRKEKITSVYYVRDPRAGPKQQGYVSLSAPDLKRGDALDIVTSEFDRCEAAIERARGVATILDGRFPGLREDLEGLLSEVMRLRGKLAAGGIGAHPAP